MVKNIIVKEMEVLCMSEKNKNNKNNKSNKNNNKNNNERIDNNNKECK